MSSNATALLANLDALTPDRLVEAHEAAWRAVRDSERGEPWHSRICETGAEAHELAPTVASLAVSAEAAERGHAFVHHELRVRVTPPEDFAPDPAVWSGAPNPEWRDGVLELPKYFGASLEAGLATFDPNHRLKWRVHELLHRCVGFFWRPDLTRFEAYLGARISELLPVLHWYGFDEIQRPHCELHLDEVLRREHCEACMALQRPAWTFDEVPVQGSRALLRASDTLDHARTELLALRREFETGRMMSTPRGSLDASSDAIAYVQGHWNRLTSWSFGAWIELFGRDGIDYASTPDALLGRVAPLLADLCDPAESLARLSGDDDAPKRARRRERQRLRDLSARVLVAIERADADDVEASLWPALERCAAHCDALWESERGGEVESGGTVSAWEELGHALAACSGLDEATRRGLMATGFMGPLPGRGNASSVASDAGLRQLRHGASSGLPDTCNDLPLELVAAFAASPEFSGVGELRGRLLAWVEGGGARALSGLEDLDPRFVDLAEWEASVRLEHFLRARPHEDTEHRHFAVLPEDAPDPGEVRLHRTLRRERFPTEVVESLMGWPATAEAERSLVRIFVDGQPRVIEADADVDAVLDAILAGEAVDPADPLCASLFQSSFACFLPRPRV